MCSFQCAFFVTFFATTCFWMLFFDQQIFDGSIYFFACWFFLLEPCPFATFLLNPFFCSFSFRSSSFPRSISSSFLTAFIRSDVSHYFLSQSSLSNLIFDASRHLFENKAAHCSRVGTILCLDALSFRERKRKNTTWRIITNTQYPVIKMMQNAAKQHFL